MKMTVFDERKETKKTFGELEIGEWFTDREGTVCLKVDENRGLYLDCVEDWENDHFEDCEIVTPIEVEVHIIG